MGSFTLDTPVSPLQLWKKTKCPKKTTTEKKYLFPAKFYSSEPTWTLPVNVCGPDVTPCHGSANKWIITQSTKALKLISEWEQISLARFSCSPRFKFIFGWNIVKFRWITLCLEWPLLCVVVCISRFVSGTNISIPTHYFAVMTSCRNSTRPVAACDGELQTVSFLLPHRSDNSESCKVRNRSLTTSLDYHTLPQTTKTKSQCETASPLTDFHVAWLWTKPCCAMLLFQSHSCVVMKGMSKPLHRTISALLSHLH